MSARLARLWQRVLGRRSWGLNGLDLKLLEHVAHRGGVFVEAGANDGLSQSNTCYYERYLGWTGLLVEPVPELAERCRRARPRAIVENVALVASDYGSPEIDLRYCNLMSVVKGGLKTRAEEDEHVRKGCDVQGIESYEMRVPTATLSALLDRHRMERIDLLSLDVEGYEASVLDGLDLRRFRPRHILVEARYRADVMRILLPRYRLVAELSAHDLLFKDAGIR